MLNEKPFTDNEEYMKLYNKWYSEFILLFKSKKILYNPFGLTKDIDNKLEEAYKLKLFTREDTDKLKEEYKMEFRKQFKSIKDKYKK